MSKPRPIEFLLRGYELADCLQIIAVWDCLTAQQREAIMASPRPLAPPSLKLVAGTPTLQ